MVETLNISIRGNINAALVERHNEKVRLEEEARRVQFGTSNTYGSAEANDWRDKHPNMWRFTSATFYNQHPTRNGLGATAPCDISFYEWSDVFREPRKFSTYLDLYEFLDECGLCLEYSLNNMLRQHDKGQFFLSCLKGRKGIAGSDTYDSLKKIVEG